ncbi:hypothetical protein PMAYCL1PPCAC_10467, partial [Pristionchus mayeri]
NRMVAGISLRCAAVLLIGLVFLAPLSEGKRGGGNNNSSRGSSSARSSSKTSSKSSGSKSYYSSTNSKSDHSAEWSVPSGHVSRGRSTWNSATNPIPRVRIGDASKSGKTFSWSSTNPRPSVTRDSVSRGLFYSYLPTYGYNSANHFTVYHFYPRSHYHTQRAATTMTPTPAGPNAEHVVSVLNITVTIDDPDAVNVTDVMEIVEPTRPLVIQDLAFFWDTNYLPSKHTPNCTTYVPANDNNPIEFCKIDELQRCKRNLQELRGFPNGSIFFPDGTSPSHLAWMCPKGTVCCDWECCQSKSGFSIGEWLLIILATGVVIYYTIRCALRCYRTGHEIKEERGIRKEEKRKLTLASSKAPSFDLP